MKTLKAISYAGLLGFLTAGSVASSAVSFEAPFSFLQSPANKEAKTRSSDEPEILEQIDAAMILIMKTQVGLSICKGILNAEPTQISYHLGVSAGAAQRIAEGCKNSNGRHDWIQSSPVEALQKFSVNPEAHRHYLFVINGDSIPFDSWTEPYSNTTVFVIHSLRDKPINRSRLIQLLAHETAVYFDAKSQLGHDDSQNLPQIKNISFLVNKLEAKGRPQVAVMNPMIAHTMTFVRAMMVERQIVSEIASWGEIEMPEEYSDPLIANLTSQYCETSCLEDLVTQMSDIYLPLALPLTAFSPTYLSQKRSEVDPLSKTDKETWEQLNLALRVYPQEYMSSIDQFKQRPFMELIQFFANPSAMPEFAKEESIFKRFLWPQDWQTVQSTKIREGRGEPVSLLLFMKRPLLSGYNILFSNGPRVRIRAGDGL